MSKIYFEIVKEKQVVNGICLICGKKRKKTICVENTINPFNRNEDGLMKNRDQVYADVREQLRKEVEKLKQKFICASCKYDQV